MYRFHLNNEYQDAFARIEYDEEKILNSLYEKDIPFIKKLWERYYDDCVFSKEELQNAQKDLMAIIDLSKYENLDKIEIKKQLQLIYKLIAIVSYALHCDCNLVGIGD